MSSSGGSESVIRSVSVSTETSEPRGAAAARRWPGGDEDGRAFGRECYEPQVVIMVMADDDSPGGP